VKGERFTISARRDPPSGGADGRDDKDAYERKIATPTPKAHLIELSSPTLRGSQMEMRQTGLRTTTEVLEFWCFLPNTMAGGMS